MVQVEEKTLELAMVKAASQLGITQGELEYKVVSKSAGLLGIFGRKICIEAWPRMKSSPELSSRNARSRPSPAHEGRDRRPSPRNGSPSHQRPDRVESKSSHRPERGEFKQPSRPERGESKDRPRRPVHQNQPNKQRPSAPQQPPRQEAGSPRTNSMTAVVMPNAQQRDDLEDFCRRLCETVAGAEVQLRCEADGDHLLFDVAHDSFKELNLKKPKLIESLEHLIRKRLAKLIPGENGLKIFVDINQSRKGHESELINMAKDLSNKVSEKKKPIVLNYRNPFDRKIIHLALENDSRVYTKSIGVGRNRKLMILPSKK